MPEFPDYQSIGAEQQRWLGRARALVKETLGEKVAQQFDQVADQLQGGVLVQHYLPHLTQHLYNALATAELYAPAAAQGAFIPANNRFDAFAAINKLLQSAKTDVLIVDPYMDESILTEFGGSVPDGIPLRLLSDGASVRPALAPAAKAWASQHGTKRPLFFRLAPQKTLHDRVILIDRTTAHTLTQSLKDFAKRSPAEIVRTDDTAALKISAYEAVWAAAKVVV
jgi:hypothetical protein